MVARLKETVAGQCNSLGGRPAGSRLSWAHGLATGSRRFHAGMRIDRVRARLGGAAQKALIGLSRAGCRWSARSWWAVVHSGTEPGTVSAGASLVISVFNRATWSRGKPVRTSVSARTTFPTASMTPPWASWVADSRGWLTSAEGGVEVDGSRSRVEPWGLMPRWEFRAWLVFILAQPFPVVFLVADLLARQGELSGRPWLPWAVLLVDVALLGLAGWRMRVTRRPPDPAGRYALRQRALRAEGDE